MLSGFLLLVFKLRAYTSFLIAVSLSTFSEFTLIIVTTWHDVGWINEDEKLQLLQQASLLLVPSAFEGQPLVILEALACGLPVLTSDLVMGLPDSVMVAAYQNIDQWTSAIIKMLNAPQTASQLIEESQAYSITLIAKKWEDLYSRMLGMN